MMTLHKLGEVFLIIWGEKMLVQSQDKGKQKLDVSAKFRVKYRILNTHLFVMCFKELIFRLNL